MNLDRRTLLVIGMLLTVVSFIIIYAMAITGEESPASGTMEAPQVPELKEEKREYDNRLEAVDDLSDKKQTTPPGLYDEDLIDENGEYDIYLDEKEKRMLMDSILNIGPDLQDYHYEEPIVGFTSKSIDTIASAIQEVIGVQIGQGHSRFFLSPTQESKKEGSEKPILAQVNGDQVIRKDQRLELRLMEPIIIGKDTLPRNSILYAFCSFQPNRLLLEVQEVGLEKKSFEAYDISDGQQGIYIENSFRSRATTEVIDDVIQDINISGLPQVSGLKGIFQRSNRSVKVKVLHQYQLYLKPVL